MKTLPCLIMLLLCTAVGQERVHCRAESSTRAMHNPIPGAILVLKDYDARIVCKFGGYFQFQPLPPGSYTVHVSAIGFEPRDYTMVLRSGGNAVLLFELRETVYH